MPLPADFGTGHVTGTFVTLAGSPVVGWLDFALDPTVAALIDAAHLTVIMPSTLRATLDGSGGFAADLPGTDDPDIDPNGYTYIVQETFANATGRRYRLAVPVGVTTDISTVVA